MRRAARAIVIKDGHMLVMHRDKFGVVYDTLPGGRVEMGESLQDALLREIDEETTLSITDPRLVFIEHAGDPYGDQYVFLCNYVSGEPKLRADSDEAQINNLGENLYNPCWLDINELPKKPFVSEMLKKKILLAIKNGWPLAPQEF